MSQRGGLNIVEALENLNTLVDANALDEIEVTEESRLIPHKKNEEGRDEIYWVQAGSDDQTLYAIKKTFRSVFDYLQVFYNKMKKRGETKQLVEGVNTIMVLVGEAAKKLENFGTLFKERVTDFPEYKELQNFYKKKVIQEAFQDFAKPPIPKEGDEVLSEQQEWERELQELLKEEEPIEEIAGVHILNDIEVIKRDHLYELFFLKNEAGYNFYTYDLARNIKLACDFGEFSEEYFGDDPLLQIKNWEDKELHLFSIKLLKAIRHPLEKFYKEAMRYKEMEVMALLHNACMALMLAANQNNLIRQFSLKGCHLYFADFLYFLRQVLLNREYEKLEIYGPPPGKLFFQYALDLLHSLCVELHLLSHDHTELNAAINSLIERAKLPKSKLLSDTLFHAYFGLKNVFLKHPNGPIFKAVDIIRDGREHFFDPLMQGNLPELVSILRNKNKEIKILRLPCPTAQEYINFAVVTEEFKTFLRALAPEERLLLINFQDRTSWKEHARCHAIEELSQQGEFASNLTVITLGCDTDFYNQSGVYQELNEAKGFIGHFADHLKDESTGYFFPALLKKQLFPTFIDSLFIRIHETFFNRAPTLTYFQRLDFITLGYYLITLKLIEMLQPTYLALSSKDALDLGGTHCAGLLSLLSLGSGKKIEIQMIESMLFGPTLMQRERVIHPERFDRLCAFIRLLEEKENVLNSFRNLYKKETLEWGIGKV